MCEQKWAMRSWAEPGREQGYRNGKGVRTLSNDFDLDPSVLWEHLLPWWWLPAIHLSVTTSVSLLSNITVFRWATLPYPGNGQVVLGFLVLLGFNVLFAIIASSLIALEVSRWSHDWSWTIWLVNWLLIGKQIATWPHLSDLIGRLWLMLYREHNVLCLA